MRDFVFVRKDDATKKATLRVDMVEDKVEKLTIMWCGVTVFVIPSLRKSFLGNAVL